VWTTKRVLILIGTLPLFIAGFLVYAYFLGGIDGLPPLPIDFLPGTIIADGAPDGPPQPSDEKKLTLAFGNECEEQRRPIILDLNSKSFILASNQMDIEPDGRVKLSPFSAALFPKTRSETKFPEINVVQCEIAYLTLDRAVTSLTELNNRRIVGIELKSNREVVLINNRGTPEKHDDIELVITHDSLFFDDNRHLIWTDGYVKLQDNQTQPHPTLITGKGMDLQLAKESVSGKRPQSANKGESVHGVEMLTLKANVEMHFYVDGKAGFLGGADPSKAKATGTEKTPVLDRAHLVIKTPGKFQYDMARELAWFDSPEPNPKAPPAAPEEITVLRKHKSAGGEKIDQLVCDHLELQLKRKSRDAAPGSRGQKGVDKDIETALATARAGRDVVLTMDTEDLIAWGNELHYRSPSPTTGPQTTLKGAPMNAIKEGHKIQCQELHLIGADKKGIGQQAFAKGPGQIDLFDKSNVKKPYPYHAFWKDSLISTKDRDGDKVYDLLTLTGDAAFIDEEHKQQLGGQRLQVWLSPPGKAAPGSASVKGSTAPTKQRPHRIDAFERVTMRSPEMIIDRSNHLVVRFQNDDSVEMTLPDRLPAKKDGAAADAPPAPLGGPVAVATPPIDPTAPAPPKVEGKKAPALGTPTLETPVADTNAKNRNPIHLQANEIVAYVASKGSKKELLEVVCEGVVHVRQEGSNPKDKGVEITGEMLNLLRHPAGDSLYVFGDSRKQAFLQIGELMLKGPKVVINQKTNIAEVDGPGAMQMPSNKSFDGGKATKPGARLTVHWNKDMIFNGKDADFNGGVLAYQDEAAMKCDFLQVTLDRVVSLKEGQKGKQQAAVEKLLCHRKVYIEDRSVDPTGKLLQYNRLLASELAVDNQEGPTIAHGPGRVIHIGLGAVDDLAGKPGATPPPKTGLVLKRTRIDFEGRMFSNNKTETRNAKFYDNVEVYHDLTGDPDAAVDPDKPGKGSFYMRCDLLSVFSRVEKDGKSSQEMEAKGKIFFRAEEFFGRSDVVKYDQSKEQIIFEGPPGNPATLYKQRGPGVEPQEIKGTKIMYNRRTGEFHLEGGKVLRSSLDAWTPDGIPSGRPLGIQIVGRESGAGQAARARNGEGLRRQG